MIGATLWGVIPFTSQYLELSHSARPLAPLLALQAIQHRAMLLRVITAASLMMCSQDGLLRRLGAEWSNSTPQ
jgi:hypothetical protein